MLNLRVENYIVTISIPVRTHFTLAKNMSIWEAKDFFIKLRDNKLNKHDEAVELDRVRALLKFAANVNAQLYAIERRKFDLKICFMFMTRIDQTFFLENFKEAVEKATMK